MTTAVRDLRIAEDFALPLDAITEAIALLAQRGAGKTNTAGTTCHHRRSEIRGEAFYAK